MASTAALKKLLETYDEINGPVERFDKMPSAVEFAKLVHRNRPFVVKTEETWPAVGKWNKGYLLEKMKGKEISVAETPSGNADSVVETEAGEQLFVKPHTKRMEFSSFMEQLVDTSRETVLYAQAQDSSLTQEFTPLESDLDTSSLDFAREVLGKPEAKNVWIGTSASTSAMHKDPYENLYMTITGEKHFTLLPPIAVCAVREKDFKAATYSEKMDIIMDEPQETVRNWPSVDPDEPFDAPELFRYIKPVWIDLHPGELLYLPALWYHKVSQSDGDEGFCCAVNFWYDMEFSGSFYPLCEFVRDCTRDLEGRETSDLNTGPS